MSTYRPHPRDIQVSVGTPGLDTMFATEPKSQSYAVEFTPSPPRIGVLTRLVLDATSEADARSKIKARHNPLMIHRVTLLSARVVA